MPPAFVKLLQVRFLFTLATQMQAVMLGWHMYALTHDVLYLGFIGLAEATPALGLALFAGYLVDRRPPVRMLQRVVWLSCLSTGVFLLGQSPAVARTVGFAGQVGALLATSVLTGVARAFAQPSVYATVPRLVPRAQLGAATARMAAAMQVARILGPAIGGLLHAAVGLPPTAGCSLLLLLAAAGLLADMPKLAQAPGTLQAFSWGDFLAGGRFVFGQPVLCSALFLDMLSVLFGGVTALLPVYADEVLHIGSQGLGLLRAAPAVGAALGSAALAYVHLGARAGSALLAAVAGFGACMVVFGLSTSLPLSTAVLVLSGALDSVSVVIRSSVVQMMSPPTLRGRIAAVNAMFIGSSNELGELESGLAAKAFGTVPAVVGGGVACLLVVFGMGLGVRSLRRLDLSEKAHDGLSA